MPDLAKILRTLYYKGQSHEESRDEAVAHAVADIRALLTSKLKPQEWDAAAREHLDRLIGRRDFVKGRIKEAERLYDREELAALQWGIRLIRQASGTKDVIDRL